MGEDILYETGEMICKGPKGLTLGEPVKIRISLRKINGDNYFVFPDCVHSAYGDEGENYCDKEGHRRKCRHELSSSLLKNKFFPKIKIEDLQPLD